MTKLQMLQFVCIMVGLVATVVYLREILLEVRKK